MKDEIEDTLACEDDTEWGDGSGTTDSNGDGQGSGNTSSPMSADRRTLTNTSKEQSRSDRSMLSSCSVIAAPENGLSPVCATCIVINYISVGFILLPYAFAQGGLFLTPVVLAVVAVQSVVAAQYVMEAGARAEAVETFKTQNALPEEFRQDICIRQRKFEISTLCNMFLGRTWSHVFTAATAFDLYGISWAFCSVFAAAFADQFPVESNDNEGDGNDDQWSYRFYVLIFMLIAAPLSCTSLLDQLYLQLIFLACRMLMVLFMLITLIEAFMNGSSSRFGSHAGPARGVPLADWSNLVLVIQIAVFSTAFQFCVPAVASASRTKKRSLPSIFQGAVTFIYVSNMVVGLLAAIYFGVGETNTSNNLNWSTYHGPLGKLVATYVVLFAAIDGIAVYPLIAVSLGDILMGAVHGDNIHTAEKDWRLRVVYRLVASIPQSIGAFFVRDLGAIAKVAGIFTLLAYTACPAMLQLASGRAMAEKGLPVSTCYSNVLSNDFTAYSLLLAVVVIIFMVILGLFALS